MLNLGNFLADIRYHDIRVIGLAWLGHLDKLTSISQDDLVVWENPGTGQSISILTHHVFLLRIFTCFSSIFIPCVGL